MSRANQGAAESRRHTLAVLAENRDGVLSRMTALFDARGYMVDSIAVGPALDSSFIRMVVVVQGDERVIEQVIKQLRKLIEVIKVTDLTDVEHVEREMLLVRVAARTESRAEIARIAEIYKARVVDQTGDTYVLEVAGEESKLSSVIDLLRPFGILEIARTGKIAMARGIGAHEAADSGVTGRKHLRHSVGFEVRVAEHQLDSPARVRAHDISVGGMSLKTSKELAIGTTITMQIVHPATGQQLPLHAVVRRHIVRPDFRGIGVEFVDVDDAHRQRLDEFMSGESAGPAELEPF